MRKTLLITNLCSCVSDCALRGLFSEYGKVCWIYLRWNFRGKSTWGLVQMKHRHDADHAIKALNGFSWHDRKLRVKAR